MEGTDKEKSLEERTETQSRHSDVTEETVVRSTWNNGIEFLMSCIAMSIGFGNIWRFPFTAYENGGGVFLIPYIIVLFLVGKPFYYLEMIMGQFSSSSSIRVWNMSPAFIGVGWAQLCSNVALMTYYSSLMSLTLFFLIASFSAELPWGKCREEWADYCMDSSRKIENHTNTSDISTFAKLLVDKEKRSSAELYFLKVVLQEKDSIDDGIGLPDWKLTLCLLVSWVSVIMITFQGVKSSGKASYFLAIFPYIILVSLLVRAVTLEGAGDGILFFVTPRWSKLLEPTVWYAAVTQCFFSLSVCFGVIVTYSSHNDFKHNIYRDALIVTSLDTLTSFIAGCTIFGILGNLAHEMGIKDIDKVVKSGAGLAFVSYPDAIAKFTFLPQLFAVLFFVMMFVLGVGSTVGMVSGIVSSLKEKLPNVQIWKIVITGGQFLLTLVDYYGTSFVVFILASFEITAITWLYGSKVVLQEKDSIDDGIGLPDWKLTLCLLVSWVSVIMITFQGVKSSGKASYFLAIFPYIILVSLLVRAVTLEGAGDGILFFVTPRWSKLLEPTVWYAAVTQCFFSLSVCFGVIVTYSSHNDFKHNIYRDALIVTSLDTLTSFIAGCTIFGILGNLAHEMGIKDIDKVVKSGAGLAFVSYPDAIAKFTFLPQLFAVLFFVMMFVLGVGSTVGMVSGIVSSLKEKLPNVQIWKIVITVCLMGFAVSTVYVTPVTCTQGGQFLLTLVDYYGTSFVVFILASFEITAITWLYGIENLLEDIEFMLMRKPSSYWRICWFLVTPLILIAIFIYTVATLSPLTYGERGYPVSAHAAGASILCFSIFQIPFWMIVEMLKNRNLPLSQVP
ncbi:Sodium-dependent nutrient amino acid transporter 1 [Habropoda laboriosa]|uniref:Transporter n=1 Tax=Habropoda laboriosa TaxID=597456 RepID=A0A0L7RFA1_9HYME|nr:Sodium-dependent nutrient amino acid transporter 1 [Habropoda laboriosa]